MILSDSICATVIFSHRYRQMLSFTCLLSESHTIRVCNGCVTFVSWTKTAIPSYGYCSIAILSCVTIDNVEVLEVITRRC